MVNFRFHLVSLTAVFLALGLGLVIGSTVVNRVTVETIQRQLERVRARADAVNAENEELQAGLERSRQFGDQAGRRLVEGRLRDVPVLIVTVAGGPDERTNELERALASAGADYQGRLTLTERWRLQGAADAAALARAVGAATTRPEAARRAAFDVLAVAVRTGEQPGALAALGEEGFVSYDGPRSLVELPAAGTRVLVVSDDDPAVSNDLVALPLVSALAEGEVPVVVAAPLVGEKATLSRFIAAIRKSGSAPRVSTVDNLGVEGEAATVLALEDLGAGRLGHYGLGEGAATVLPESTVQE